MRAQISLAFAGLVLASTFGTAAVAQFAAQSAQQSQSVDLIAYRGSGRIDPLSESTSVNG
jgi:hypothetical protein